MTLVHQLLGASKLAAFVVSSKQRHILIMRPSIFGKLKIWSFTGLKSGKGGNRFKTLEKRGVVPQIAASHEGLVR